MYNNYRQSLDIIARYSPEVRQFQCANGFSDEDFLKWRDEEATYLSNVTKGSPEDVLKVAYVEALQRLEKEKWVPAETSASLLMKQYNLQCTMGEFDYSTVAALHPIESGAIGISPAKGTITGECMGGWAAKHHEQAGIGY
jgi:hypothetical protein